MLSPCPAIVRAIARFPFPPFLVPHAPSAVVVVSRDATIALVANTRHYTWVEAHSIVERIQAAKALTPHTSHHG